EGVRAGWESLRGGWCPNPTAGALVGTAGTSFEGLVAVYTGATLSSLRTVASGENPPGKNQAALHFTATNGITYHIAVAGSAPDQTGTIRLRIEFGGEQDTNAPLVHIDSPPSGLILTNAANAQVVVSGTAIDPQPNASGVKEVLVQVNNDVASSAFGTTNWISTNILQF